MSMEPSNVLSVVSAGMASSAKKLEKAGLRISNAMCSVVPAAPGEPCLVYWEAELTLSPPVVPGSRTDDTALKTGTFGSLESCSSKDVVEISPPSSPKRGKARRGFRSLRPIPLHLPGTRNSWTGSSEHMAPPVNGPLKSTFTGEALELESPVVRSKKRPRRMCIPEDPGLTDTKVKETSSSMISEVPSSN
jgi:hypothetical protein